MLTGEPVEEPIEEEESEWFKRTKLGNDCNSETHCQHCKPNGDCDPCDTIDGRWITAVSDHASTCDGCGELTSHEEMRMDSETQLGYCFVCVPKLPPEILMRLLD